MTEHKEDNTIEGPAATNLRRVQKQMARAESRLVLDADWSYFFTHNVRLKHIIQKLKADNFFPTFVHQSCNYIRNHDKVCKQLRPTISGLIFIQGEVKAIEAYFKDRLPELHLARDYATRCVARIPHAVMQPFMKIAELDATRIRFLLHPFEHYAGSQLVRITSGPMAGLEGYIIRIDRDRKLVMRVGDLTIAVGGIHRESFENVADYIRMRRAEEHESAAASEKGLTDLQTAVERTLFKPQTSTDRLLLAGSGARWIETAQQADWGAALEILCYLWERLAAFRQDLMLTDIAGRELITRLSRQVSMQLDALLDAPNRPVDIAEKIEVWRDEILLRNSFVCVGRDSTPMPVAAERR
mgnify:FL=1